MEMGWPCWIVLLLHLLLLLPFVFNQTHVVNNLPHNRLLLLCSSTLHQGLAFQEFTYHNLGEKSGTASPCGHHTPRPFCCACGVKVLRPSLALPTHNQLSMQKIFSLHDSESHFEVTNLVFGSENLLAIHKSAAATRETWSDLKKALLWPKGSQISCAHRFSRDLESFIATMEPSYKLSEPLIPSSASSKIWNPMVYPTTDVTLENKKEEEMDVTCAHTLDRKRQKTFQMKKGSTTTLRLRKRHDIFHACHFSAGKGMFNMVIFVYAYFELFVGPINYVGLMEDGLVYGWQNELQD